MNFVTFLYDSDYLTKRFISLDNCCLLSTGIPMKHPKVFFTQNLSYDTSCDILVIQCVSLESFKEFKRCQMLARTVILTLEPFIALDQFINYYSKNASKSELEVSNNSDITSYQDFKKNAIRNSKINQIKLKRSQLQESFPIKTFLIHSDIYNVMPNSKFVNVFDRTILFSSESELQMPAFGYNLSAKPFKKINTIPGCEIINRNCWVTGKINSIFKSCGRTLKSSSYNNHPESEMDFSQLQKDESVGFNTFKSLSDMATSKRTLRAFQCKLSKKDLSAYKSRKLNEDLRNDHNPFICSYNDDDTSFLVTRFTKLGKPTYRRKNDKNSNYIFEIKDFISSLPTLFNSNLSSQVGNEQSEYSSSIGFSPINEVNTDLSTSINRVKLPHPSRKYHRGVNENIGRRCLFKPKHHFNSTFFYNKNHKSNR